MHFFCLVCHGEVSSNGSLTPSGQQQIHAAACRLPSAMMNLTIAGLAAPDGRARASAEIIHRELSFIFDEAYELSFVRGRSVQPLLLLEERVRHIPADALLLVGSPDNSRHLAHLVASVYGVQPSPPALSFGDVLCFCDPHKGYVFL